MAQRLRRRQRTWHAFRRTHHFHHPYHAPRKGAPHARTRRHRDSTPRTSTLVTCMDDLAHPALRRHHSRRTALAPRELHRPHPHSRAHHLHAQHLCSPPRPPRIRMESSQNVATFLALTRGSPIRALLHRTDLAHYRYVVGRSPGIARREVRPAHAAVPRPDSRHRRHPRQRALISRARAPRVEYPPHAPRLSPKLRITRLRRHASSSLRYQGAAHHSLTQHRPSGIASKLSPHALSTLRRALDVQPHHPHHPTPPLRHV